MQDGPEAFDPRPLTFGEIFDRAITLVSRNLPLCLILSLFPAVYAAIQGGKSFESFSYIFTVASHHGVAGTARPPSGSNGILLLYWILLVPLGATMGLGLFQAYFGRKIDIAPQFGISFKRYYNLSRPILAFYATAIPFGILVMLATVILFFIVGLVFATNHVIGVLLGIVFGLVIFGAMVACGLVYLGLTPLAWLGICVEGATAGGVVKNSLNIITNREMLTRVMLFGLLRLAVGMAYMLFFSVGAGIAAATHASAVMVLVFAIGTLVYFPFQYALDVVFYIDMTLRFGSLDSATACSERFSRLAPSVV